MVIFNFRLTFLLFTTSTLNLEISKFFCCST